MKMVPRPFTRSNCVLADAVKETFISAVKYGIYTKTIQINGIYIFLPSKNYTGSVRMTPTLILDWQVSRAVKFSLL